MSEAATWFNYKRAIRVFAVLSTAVLLWPASLVGEHDRRSAPFQDSWGITHETPFSGHYFVGWGTAIPLIYWGWNRSTEQSELDILRVPRRIIPEQLICELAAALAFSVLLGAFSRPSIR